MNFSVVNVELLLITTHTGTVQSERVNASI